MVLRLRMSGNKEWFSTLSENFQHNVKLGNDTYIVVIGKRSVKDRTKPS